MLTAIIVEDEQHCVDRLLDLLKPHHGDIEVVGVYKAYSEALLALKKVQPDFIFLDVQLANRTGFELLKELQPISFEVVFTTAHEKYAIEAFDFSALDYLLKPIDPADLERSITKLKKTLSSDLGKKMETLFHNLQLEQNITKRIAIPTTEGLTFVSLTDIVRCQADTNYTHIHISNGSRLTVAKTLKQFEQLLGDYGFFRVHNSHLINLAFIKKYNKGKQGTVEMDDGSEIEVSIRRKDPFLKRLKQQEMLLP